jgi:hypothetical protein
MCRSKVPARTYIRGDAMVVKAATQQARKKGKLQQATHRRILVVVVLVLKVPLDGRLAGGLERVLVVVVVPATSARLTVNCCGAHIVHG